MIIEREQRRALDFVAAANRGGHRPIAEEIEQWRTNPRQKPGPRGELIRPAQAGKLTKQIGGGAENLSAVVSQVATALSVWVGSPAIYALDGPPEDFLAHLVRLAWLERDASGRFGVTALANALMRSDDLEGSDDEAVQTVVLGGGDPLAYGRLIRAIAECGDALVVDPYLRVEGLHDLLTHTDASRFLIGSHLKRPRVVEMAVLLQSRQEGHVVELRQAAEGVLHDRYIVGDSGAYLVGSSINAVGGSSTTVMTPLGAVADEMRTKANDWWAGAESIARSGAIAQVESFDTDLDA